MPEEQGECHGGYKHQLIGERIGKIQQNMKNIKLLVFNAQNRKEDLDTA